MVIAPVRSHLIPKPSRDTGSMVGMDGSMDNVNNGSVTKMENSENGLGKTAALSADYWSITGFEKGTNLHNY